MNVSWSPGDVSIVEHHVFVFTSEFNDVSNLTTTLTAGADLTSIEVREDSIARLLRMASPIMSLPLDWTSTATPPQTSQPLDPSIHATIRLYRPRWTSPTPTLRRAN